MNQPFPFRQLLPLPGEAGRYAVRMQIGNAVPAPALPLAFEPFLYLKPDHLVLQILDNQIVEFYLEDQQLALTVAQLFLFSDPAGGVAHSPWQAPFGAVQMALEVAEASLRAFLVIVQAQLAQRGIRSVRIKSYPFAYDPSGSAHLTQALTALGYSVTLAEINTYLPLDQDFVENLHPSERRRLRKCRRAGFVFEQEPPWLLPQAYEFLSRCRAEKEQSLSLGLERLQELFRRFPRDYFLFSVRDAAGQWAALTVAIRVSSGILYNFYPASPLTYNEFSPAVMLTEGLHAFGRANHMRLLDLGTSTLPTGLNEPLLRFKRHLGGVQGLRLSFEKSIP